MVSRATTRAMGVRGQVQTMSRTSCLVSNGFTPSLSICLHFCPNLVLTPFSLAWTGATSSALVPQLSPLLSSLSSLKQPPEGACKHMNQIQTLLCPQAPTSPPTFLGVGPLVLPLAHTALHHLPLSSPPALTFSLSPPCSFCSSHRGFLAVPPTHWQGPASGPSHVLFSLPGPLFP